MKIWNKVPIKDCQEKLVTIPNIFQFVDPHPYFTLGAPYKDGNCIWKLREEVVRRILKVNDYLESEESEFRLLIYDSWRPIKVQEFMFKRAFNLECKKLNIDPPTENMSAYSIIIKKVEKFWAYPSFDENCPPPHSTGGALDVTLSDKFGNPIDMGGQIDQMDETSKPNFYKNIQEENAFLLNSRRIFLQEIMTKFGFAQHPNEWWHFSYGDQLWAWINKEQYALYGKI